MPQRGAAYLVPNLCTSSDADARRKDLERGERPDCSTPAMPVTRLDSVVIRYSAYFRPRVSQDVKPVCGNQMRSDLPVQRDKIHRDNFSEPLSP